MRRNYRWWLAGAAAATVAGACVLGQAELASAVGQAPSVAGQVAATAAPGSVYVPSGTTLHMGSRGAAVRALQRRLAFLHYYPGAIDGRFGWSTMEAVWAFKEVQTGKMIPANPNIVGPTMQRELVHPKGPKALDARGPSTRVEVHKRIEVLIVYRDNKIALISHTSSAAYYRPDGTGWVTPDGKYRAWEYIPGCVADATFGGCMYNPVFFISTTFAIHGMPNPTSTFSGDGVPLNPASHGCIRIPMDVSLIFHKLIRVSATRGTPIFVSGPNYYGNGAFQ